MAGLPAALRSGRCGAFRLRPCPQPSRSYNAAVLDIKLIREQPDWARQRLATRGAGGEEAVDELLALDEQRRKLVGEVEGLKAERNRVSKEIGTLMAQKKAAEAEARKTETRQIGEKIGELDLLVAACQTKRDEILMRLPNFPHSSVPLGKTAADNPEIRAWGEKRDFNFKPRSHVAICDNLKLVDFAR